MANYEQVTIKCNEELKEYFKNYYNNGFHRLQENKDGVSIENIEGYTHRDLSKISKKFKYSLINVSYYFESDWYTTRHEVKYINGKDTLQDIKIDYMISYCSKDRDILEKRNLYSQVENKTKEFYKKIDSVTKKGNNFIIEDHADIEIILKFKVKDLMITTAKIGRQISIEKVEEPSKVIYTIEPCENFDIDLGVPF